MFALLAAGLTARKLWIAFAADVNGTVAVDGGAQAALTGRPTSLLPAGVVDVRTETSTNQGRGMTWALARRPQA